MAEKPSLGGNYGFAPFEIGTGFGSLAFDSTRADALAPVERQGPFANDYASGQLAMSVFQGAFVKYVA